jgi:hypothetical protein
MRIGDFDGLRDARLLGVRLMTGELGMSDGLSAASVFGSGSEVISTEGAMRSTSSFTVSEG